MSFEKIAVIGLGYIGLPTAAMFASCKKRVIGVDINKKIVDIINNGKIHIVEPDLDALVNKAVSDGYLKASLVAESADAYLIAVPTPFLPSITDDIPKPDLSYIQSACKKISPVLKKGDLIILESTSPVGTTEMISTLLSRERTDLAFPLNADDLADVNIAYCPERVLPGKVVRELVDNDRVIGGITPRCSERAVELYKIFVKGECVITNSRTAEMAKLTENSSRDVQIAFANELSMICDRLNINVWELISLANRHPRVNILQPGPGVGGHCIAVDPWFIVSQTPDQAQLIHTARIVNDLKPTWVINKIKVAIADFLQKNPRKTTKDITIACFGLAFKADIDDLRESPAMKIAVQIANEHAGKVVAVEPNVKGSFINEIALVSFEEALNIADIIVILVDHKEFKMAKSEIIGDFVIDTKGLL
ncbi:TPA: UDP-N-acetyl-D-mannosamine dehydrogenase [Escherichia coli]|uniref:UDP-N-acetyl-D-mannosamine dehydrogenase n=4 Tax=Escherichia coli TaxID=562 RepID=UPI0002A40871|nr:UDP-N-acetyl-D-mannosamine dehydrogenase [Escherichia coli]EAC1518413.1 UDP-N-acetyl-D-mannosamine dehydrogenase [Escherichia coli]EEW8167139.1 UDP-N-acetyl-D-mannosamine dehydrogenase [Escherichia coli]EEY6214557.1 UDP-N-acetyl-D-mannosamine dehydrogenase [Escherichia coli]EEZ5349450.1 UDP-N-acetyl-D-mannosamine dehydrogenase [Escherichia coli]EEZ6611994.1 UDP-N-acetyl-D-mannosamine dehydrogenase [Escherichia coli]